MSYKLTKAPPKDCKFDALTVTIEAPDDMTVAEMLEMFERFMSACGFEPYTLEATPCTYKEKTDEPT